MKNTNQRTKKPLSLNVETLRALTTGELKVVVGGDGGGAATLVVDRKAGASRYCE